MTLKEQLSFIPDIQDFLVTMKRKGSGRFGTEMYSIRIFRVEDRTKLKNYFNNNVRAVYTSLGGDLVIKIEN